MINKDNLVHLIAKKTGYNIGDSEHFLNCFIDIFQDAIDEREIINVRGFGQLKYSVTKEHMGNKPKKGIKGATEKILIPEKETVSFKLANDLRKMVKYDEEEI